MNIIYSSLRTSPVFGPRFHIRCDNIAVASGRDGRHVGDINKPTKRMFWSLLSNERTNHRPTWEPDDKGLFAVITCLRLVARQPPWLPWRPMYLRKAGADHRERGTGTERRERRASKNRNKMATNRQMIWMGEVFFLEPKLLLQCCTFCLASLSSVNACDEMSLMWVFWRKKMSLLSLILNI